MVPKRKGGKKLHGPDASRAARLMIKRLFRKYQKSLVVIAFKSLSDISDAKDVVQEVFIQFLEQNPIKVLRIKNPRSYLRTCVTRAAHKLLRERKKEQEQGIADVIKARSSLEIEISKSKMRSVDFEEKLAVLLTERQYNAFRLWLHDYSYSEIAEEMNENPEQVRGLIYRAKRNIRQLYKDGALVYHN